MMKAKKKVTVIAKKKTGWWMTRCLGSNIQKKDGDIEERASKNCRQDLIDLEEKDES